MKRKIIEVITKEFPYAHNSQCLGAFFDACVAKRYKMSPLSVCLEDENDDNVVYKGHDNCYESYMFDARQNPYVTVRAVNKVNEIETQCNSYEEFKFIAGKHGQQLGEIWCTAEMLDLKKTMDFVSKTMQLRVTGHCPVYKKFIIEVISSERSEQQLNDAIIDFYQRKLSESETSYGVRKTQNHKITIAMIAEHHWIPRRALDNMFFKIFNDETKIRRFDWLIKTLRWFPKVVPENEPFIAVAYHFPTYLTYTLWRFESGFDEYKFNMACNVLDKYLHYDCDIVDSTQPSCVRRWDWIIRWGYMLPVAIRIKLLDNIERHKYSVRWCKSTENKMIDPYWTKLGKFRTDKLDHNMRSSILVFMKALGCENIYANLFLMYNEQVMALMHESTSRS